MKNLSSMKMKKKVYDSYDWELSRYRNAVKGYPKALKKYEEDLAKWETEESKIKAKDRLSRVAKLKAELELLQKGIQ